MNGENSNPVPNLNIEELNTKRNEPRQEKNAEPITSRRAFFGRFVAGLATLATVGWLSGCTQDNPELDELKEPPEYDVIETEYDVIKTPASGGSDNVLQ